MLGGGAPEAAAGLPSDLGQAGAQTASKTCQEMCQRCHARWAWAAVGVDDEGNAVQGCCEDKDCSGVFLVPWELLWGQRRHGPQACFCICRELSGDQPSSQSVCFNHCFLDT